MSILKALKSTDDGVTEYFIVNENGKNTRNTEISLGEWKNKLEVAIWKIIDLFESMYNQVEMWIKNNSRVPLVTSSDELEKKLGKWCSHKREDMQKKT